MRARAIASGSHRWPGGTVARKFADAQLAEWAQPVAGAGKAQAWAVEVVAEALAPVAAHHGDIDLFSHGGYTNGTAVSGQSDIDVVALLRGVEMTDAAPDWLDDVPRKYQDFRLSVNHELRDSLDPGLPEPHIAAHCRVDGETIDVLAAIPYRGPDAWQDDIWFWWSDYVPPTVSWPRATWRAIEARDTALGGTFRQVVRIFKAMRDQLWGTQNDEVQSFLVESLCFQADNYAFQESDLRARCVAVLDQIKPLVLGAASPQLRDITDRLYLFEGDTCPALDRAQTFVEEAYDALI